MHFHSQNVEEIFGTYFARSVVCHVLVSLCSTKARYCICVALWAPPPLNLSFSARKECISAKLGGPHIRLRRHVG